MAKKADNKIMSVVGLFHITIPCFDLEQNNFDTVFEILHRIVVNMSLNIYASKAILTITAKQNITRR